MNKRKLVIGVIIGLFVLLLGTSAYVSYKQGKIQSGADAPVHYGYGYGYGNENALNLWLDFNNYCARDYGEQGSSFGYLPGIEGASLYLDSKDGKSDSYVNVPGNFLFPEGTVSAWIKLDYGGQNFQHRGTIVSSLRWSGNDYGHDGFNVLYNGKTKEIMFKLYAGDKLGKLYEYSHKITDTNKWIQVSVGWNQNGWVLFSVDGVVVKAFQERDGLSFRKQPSEFNVGRYNYRPDGTYFQGRIDEVKIWSRMLLNDEIKKEYTDHYK